MEDVLEVYQCPYDSEYPVVCMDEANRQLTEEVRPSLPVQPGAWQIETRTHPAKGNVRAFAVTSAATPRRSLKGKL